MVFGTQPASAPPSLEVRIQYMPQTPEILEPADGAALAHTYSDIAVRVPEGATDVLRVNGSEIPRKSIGKKIHESERKIYIFQYIGVKLAPGPNTIVLETGTPDGGKSVQSITVTAPGPLSRILLSPAKADVGADGGDPVPFKATLLDSFGKPSLQEQLLTVVLARGKVVGNDLDPASPGHQVKAIDGVASFAVRGGGETGPETLKVRGGTDLAAEAELFFVPKPRPWVVAGIADVTAGANTVSGDTGGAIDDRKFDDGFSHDERIALFAKGSIGDGYLLTGSYDTGKEKTEPLFQQEDPAKYYPMYGDGSRIGYDASSGDKLFLKVEKGRSYALYGDYRTDLTQNDFARYDRAFTGAKADVDLGMFTVRAFGAESAQFLFRDELRGNGTSGFYFLTRRPIVGGSERVRIEVRDRFHSERILKTVDKVVFTDYAVDYEAGSILFKEPVPSLDPGMNPVHIVVLYESEGTGSEFYTYGGRAAVRPWSGLEVGATAVREDRDLEKATLTGVDATLKVGKSPPGEGGGRRDRDGRERQGDRLEGRGGRDPDEQDGGLRVLPERRKGIREPLGAVRRARDRQVRGEGRLPPDPFHRTQGGRLRPGKRYGRHEAHLSRGERGARVGQRLRRGRLPESPGRDGQPGRGGLGLPHGLRVRVQAPHGPRHGDPEAQPDPLRGGDRPVRNRDGRHAGVPPHGGGQGERHRDLPVDRREAAGGALRPRDAGREKHGPHVQVRDRGHRVRRTAAVAHRPQPPVVSPQGSQAGRPCRVDRLPEGWKRHGGGSDAGRDRVGDGRRISPPRGCQGDRPDRGPVRGPGGHDPVHPGGGLEGHAGHGPSRPGESVERGPRRGERGEVRPAGGRGVPPVGDPLDLPAGHGPLHRGAGRYHRGGGMEAGHHLERHLLAGPPAPDPVG